MSTNMNNTLENATLIPSVESDKTTYLCVGDKRYIFFEGKYVGFYRP